MFIPSQSQFSNLQSKEVRLERWFNQPEYLSSTLGPGKALKENTKIIKSSNIHTCIMENKYSYNTFNLVKLISIEPSDFKFKNTILNYKKNN